MKFDEIDREIRLCYGAHQAFMRLGFNAEHIFCGVNFGRIVVALRPPSKPEFVLTACETSMELDDFSAKWAALIHAMQVDHAVDMTTREQMFDEFRSKCPAVPFLASLTEKGLLPL